MNQPRRELKNKWAVAMFLLVSLAMGFVTVRAFFGWSNTTTFDAWFMLTLTCAFMILTFVCWRFPDELRKAAKQSPERTIKSKPVEDQVLFWKQQIRAWVWAILTSPFVFYLLALIRGDPPTQFFFFLVTLWMVCIHKIWVAYKELKFLD